MIGPSLTDLIIRATDLLFFIVPILIALSLLYFFWGIAIFILNAGDTEKLKEGKQRMIWGLVVLFVIVSLAGLLAVFQYTFFGGFRGTGFRSYSPPASVIRTTGDNQPIEVREQPGGFRGFFCSIGLGCREFNR